MRPWDSDRQAEKWSHKAPAGFSLALQAKKGDTIRCVNMESVHDLCMGYVRGRRDAVRRISGTKTGDSSGLLQVGFPFSTASPAALDEGGVNRSLQRWTWSCEFRGSGSARNARLSTLGPVGEVSVYERRSPMKQRDTHSIQSNLSWASEGPIRYSRFRASPVVQLIWDDYS